MVHSSSSQNALMRFLSLLILPLFLFSSTGLTGTVSAATPPPPVGFPTGGTFAQYFQNAVNNPCPQYYYVRGFKSLPAGDYMKPDCVLGQNVDKWDVSGNAGTTNVNFIGTTDNQPLRIKTNGGDRMFIGTDGKVGIYTTTPSARLDIENRIRLDYSNPTYGIGITTIGPGGGGWARRYGFTSQDGSTRLGGFGGLGTDNALSSWWIGNDYNDYALSLDAASKNAHFPGNVGIGVTSPTAPLDIRSPIDSLINLSQPDPADGWNYIQFNSNAGRRWWMGTDSTGIFTIYRDGSAATSARIGNADLVVDNKLGIGYSNPAYPLDVNGSARVNGNFLANGVIRANSDPTYGVNLLSWGLYNNNAALDKNIYIEPQPGASLNIVPSDWSQNLSTYIHGQLNLVGNTFSFANGTGTIDYYKSGPYDQIEFGTITGSNKDVSFHTNGSSKVWIKPSGNVGIGTNTPGERLDVNGNIRGNGEISVLNGWRLTQAWGPDVVTIHNHLWDGAANNNYGNLSLGHGYYYGGLQSGGPTGWEASGYGELYAASKSMLMGNVGVGTAVPEARLTIMQPGNGWNDGINIHSPTAGFATWTILNDGGSAPGFLTIAPNTDYTKSLTINGSDGLVNVHANLGVNGNVGIGTINPSAKLEVAGQVKITGGAPGAGKILTSIDNSGLATWGAAPSSFALTNDQWIQSTPDNKNRFYFGNNSRTYFGSMNGYSFRNSVDSDIASLDNGGGYYTAGNHVIQDGAPTIYLQDTDNRSAMIHTNSDYFYILRGDGNNSTTYAAFNGVWPMTINLNNNDAAFGGNMSINGSVSSVGSMSSPTYYDRDNPAYYVDPAGSSQLSSVLANNWFRAQGDSGLYFQDHGGGWNMTDNTWIRTYGDKSIYQNTGIMRTDGTFQVGGGGGTLNVVENGNLTYRTNVLVANTAGNVGVGTAAPGAKLEVAGQIKITGGVPGAGKILTSDASGLASWSAPASGMPAAGSAGQTLYSNGTNWIASSNIFNNNGDVGIGTAIPGAKLDVTSNAFEVAQFSSTTPNAFISLYGAGVPKAFLYATGSDFNIVNTRGGVLGLGSDGIPSLFVSNSNVGVGVSNPTASLDVAGTLRLRNNPGEGKVLTSGADGTAIWRDLPASATPAAAGAPPPGYAEKNWNFDEDVYGGWVGDRADTCGNGNTPYSCGINESRSCVDRQSTETCVDNCNSEAGSCTHSCSTSYSSRDIQCIKTTILIKLSNYCATEPTCSALDNCTVTTGSPTSTNQAWAQGAANCGFTCKNGYTGANCDIPPCEDVAMGFPACETTVAVNSVNPKNRNLFKIGEYYYGFHMIKCDDTSTFADRNRYTEATIGYMNRWNVPIPNVNESHEFWGSYINANGFNTTFQGAACSVYTDPCGGGGCGGGEG